MKTYCCEVAGCDKPPVHVVCDGLTGEPFTLCQSDYDAYKKENSADKIRVGVWIKDKRKPVEEVLLAAYQHHDAGDRQVLLLFPKNSKISNKDQLSAVDGSKHDLYFIADPEKTPRAEYETDLAELIENVHGLEEYFRRKNPPKEPQAADVETHVKAESETPRRNPMIEKIAETAKKFEPEARDAASRLAGSQFLKLTQEPVVAFLSRGLDPNDQDPAVRARIAAFLETDLGKALLASVLSVGLSMLPDVAGDLPHKLGRELRVRAMAEAGDVLADLLMGPLRQVAATYIRFGGLPEDRPALPVIPVEKIESPAVETEEAEAVVTAGAAEKNRR